MPPTILVVDDDPKVLHCERLLKNGGYDVVTASDAAGALRCLGHTSVHAALIEVTLPGVSGVQLLRTMRDQGMGLPVLLMTASPSLDTAIAGMDQGALGYLIKPFGSDELIRAVLRAERISGLSAGGRRLTR